MKKGFSVLITSLILAGMTLLVGLGGSEAIKEANQDCTHSARIFLRDMSSGLLSENMEHNANISNRVRYEEMPESLSFRTEEDIVYSRDDGDIVYGYMSEDEFKAWLRCKKDV